MNMTEPIRSYRNVGKRTLAIFIISNLRFFVLFTVLFAAFIWGKKFIPPGFEDIIKIAMIAGFVIDILLIAGGIFSGWLEYIHYSLALDEHGFKVKKGFLTQRERSVPYRRIQEVTIHRSPFDLVWGVGTVVVDLLGDSDGSPVGEDRLTVNAVSSEMAAEIRDELLKRAQIEQMTVNSKQ